MKYADLAAVYLSVPATPAPVVSTTPARRLRDALEAIATQGWWAEEVHDRLEPHGFTFLDGYVWGRAAGLGEPSPGVVVATFGVFEPIFLASVYTQGRSLLGRDEVLAAREAGAVASLQRLVTVDDAVVAAGDALLDALAGLDGTARPLFCGLRDLPVPADPLGRLWRAAELVREHRGDGHLAACIAQGLDPLEMSILTERWLGYGLGEYSSTRGFGPDAVAAAVVRLAARGWMSGDDLTPAGTAVRVAIEDATDVSPGRAGGRARRSARRGGRHGDRRVRHPGGRRLRPARRSQARRRLRAAGPASRQPAGCYSAVGSILSSGTFTSVPKKRQVGSTMEPVTTPLAEPFSLSTQSSMALRCP